VGLQDRSPLVKKTDKDFDAFQAEVFERQARICKAFANSTRLHMLDLLGKRDWASSGLQENLGVSKANLSQHVAVLKALLPHGANMFTMGLVARF
jgi:hypothetical protein